MGSWLSLSQAPTPRGSVELSAALRGGGIVLGDKQVARHGGVKYVVEVDVEDAHRRPGEHIRSNNEMVPFGVITAAMSLVPTTHRTWFGGPDYSRYIRAYLLGVESDIAGGAIYHFPVVEGELDLGASLTGTDRHLLLRMFNDLVARFPVQRLEPGIYLK